MVPMNRVWTISELVDMILSHLPNNDLLNVACCSRALFDPAVVHLWTEILDLGQLSQLYLLIQEDQLPHRNLEHTLSRFTAYTRSVRSITTLDFNRWDDLSSLTSFVLAAGLLEHGCLLPRIESLEVFSYADPETMAEIFVGSSVLLTPSMKTLAIDNLSESFFDSDAEEAEVERGKNSFLCFLTLAKRRCPVLEDLSIRGLLRIDCADAFFEALVEFLSDWSSLRCVTGGDWILTRPVLCALSRLPSLVHLDSSDHYPERDSRQRIEPQNISSYVKVGGFPSLTSLHISADANEVFELIPSLGPLLELSVNFTSELVPASLGHLISKHSPGLKNLCWSHRSGSIGTALDIVTPFLSCRQMECFTFESGHVGPPAQWDDIFICRMASAWPLLRELSLGHTSSGITFASFVPLAGGCPSLRSLSLRIKSIVPISLPATMLLSEQRISLEMSGLIRPYSARQIATFIISLWPNASIEALMVGPRARMEQDLWKEVDSIIKSFQYLAKTKDIIHRNQRGTAILPDDAL